MDITEAAASMAMFLGHKYSVLTTLDRTVPLIENRLKLAGLDDRCASVRASGPGVLELESDPERAFTANAESLVRLGLKASKVRTYAPPRPKQVSGWPLEVAGVRA